MHITYRIKNLGLGLMAFMLSTSLFIASVSAATFSIDPATKTFERGCLRSVNVEIDASGQSSNAGEIYIFYDPTEIEIVDQYPGVSGTQIETGNAYESYFLNEVDTNNGIIRVAGGSFITNLSSKKTFATIWFRAKPTTIVSNFEIDFQGQGVTNDSNIADAVTNQDILTSTSNGSYNFIDAPCQADNTAPNVTFLNPTNNATGVSLSSNVSVRVTDDQSGVDLNSLQFIIDGEIYVVADDEVQYTGTDTNYSFTIDPVSNFPANQAVTIRVKGQDDAGNSFNRQITFNVPVVEGGGDGAGVSDTFAPNINFINPTSLQSGFPLDGNLELTITDENEGDVVSGVDLNQVTIVLNGNSYNINSAQLTYTGIDLGYNFILNPNSPLLPDAINVMQVFAKDLSGNSTSKQIVFNVPSGPVQCVDEGDINTGNPIVIDPNQPGDVEGIVSNCYGASIDINEVPQIFNQILKPSGDVLGDTLLENTIAADIVEESGLTGLAAVTTTIVLSFNLLPLITLLLNVPSALIEVLNAYFGRKSRAPWGIITDMVSGKPIPFSVCQLYVQGSQYKINQSVSDLEGRYGFVINPGDYRLEISQSGYKKYTEKFTIKKGEESYLNDVQLVPVDHRLSRSRAKRPRILTVLKRLYRSISIPLFILGITLSIIAVLIAFSALNVVVLLIYLVAVSYFLVPRLSTPLKYASVINSSNGLRIPYAQVKIFDLNNWKLIDSQVTNYNGQFDFYGEPGQYGLMVVARGYKFPSKKENKFDLVKEKYNSMIKVKLKKGRNELDLYVDPIDPSRSKDDMDSPFSE